MMKRTSWVLAVSCAALGARPSLVHAQATRSARPVEVYEASITDLQEAMASGRTTSVALVEAYLARIAAYDQRGLAGAGQPSNERPRVRGQAASHCRRGHSRQIEHARAGRGHYDHQLARRADAQSVRSAKVSWRVQRRDRGCDRGELCGGGLGLGHVWLDSNSVRVRQPRRPAANAGTREPQRRDAAVPHAERPGPTDGQLYLSLVTADQAPVQARVVIPR